MFTFCSLVLRASDASSTIDCIGAVGTINRIWGGYPPGGGRRRGFLKKGGSSAPCAFLPAFKHCLVPVTHDGLAFLEEV